jgi:urease gamma subunit
LQISPHEQERLLIHVAADVARRRQERGLLLNYPESVAILSSWVFEAARDGRTVADIMSAGREVLRTTDVMEGIAALLDELQVEATFPDGTKLVTLHSPIQSPEAS